MILLIVGLIYTAMCIFLILVVLMQSGKGGGLSGMLGGGNPLTDALGSSGAEKTLSKWTTICAVGFFVLSLLLTILGAKYMKPSALSDQLKSTAVPASPAAPSTRQAPTAVGPESTPQSPQDKSEPGPSEAKPAESSPAPAQATPPSEPSPSSP